jgi:hypothetical protein
MLMSNYNSGYDYHFNPQGLMVVAFIGAHRFNGGWII